jgi:acyl dehydratase
MTTAQPRSWRDLTDPRRAHTVGDLESGLREPTFENIMIPEDFGPASIFIDEHKLRRYAFQQDDYRYYRHPSVGPVAPAALLLNDLLQLFTLNYAASRVVGLHTDEEVWFLAPVKIGQTITLSGRYVEKYENRGQGYVVMEAEARNSQGEILVRHRGVEIMRTSPAEVAGRGSRAHDARRRVTGEFDARLPLVQTIGSGIRPGCALEPLTKHTTIEQMALFSRLAEFVTNIHNDLRTARAAGLAMPIVQGQQLVGYLVELLHRAFGPHWLTTGSLRTKFLRPVSAFDSVQVQALVREASIANDVLRVELDVWVKDEDGKLSAVGWASGSVPTTQPVVTISAGEGV